MAVVVLAVVAAACGSANVTVPGPDTLLHIVVGGGPLVPVLVGAILGLLLGLYITRTKPGPIDDE